MNIKHFGNTPRVSFQQMYSGGTRYNYVKYMHYLSWYNIIHGFLCSCKRKRWREKKGDSLSCISLMLGLELGVGILGLMTNGAICH